MILLDILYTVGLIKGFTSDWHNYESTLHAVVSVQLSTVCGQEPQREVGEFVVVWSRGICALGSAVQLKLWENTLF